MSAYIYTDFEITQHVGIVLVGPDMLLPQEDCGLALMTSDSPVFEIRITTSETGSILRAPTEREVAMKVEP